VLGRTSLNPIDVEAVKSIPEDYIQETPLTRNQASALIHKMERKGAIPKREFRVRTFREGDTKKVAFYHRPSTEQAPGGKLVSEIPTPENAASFIQSQPEFRHDLTMLSQRYLKREVSSHEDGGLYYAMRHVAIQARQLIEREQGGKFIEEKAGHRKFYKWTK
jgi:hypothetical protein